MKFRRSSPEAAASPGLDSAPSQGNLLAEELAEELRRRQLEEQKAERQALTDEIRGPLRDMKGRIQPGFLQRILDGGIAHDNDKPGGPLADAFAQAMRERELPPVIYSETRSRIGIITLIDPDNVRGDDFAIYHDGDNPKLPFDINYRGNSSSWNQGRGEFEPVRDPKPDHGSARVVRYETVPDFATKDPANEGRIAPVSAELKAQVLALLTDNNDQGSE